MLIAQLSDLHVRPAAQPYQGIIDSNRSLTRAIARLQAMDAPIDLVLLTGDLVDEGQPDEYAELRARLTELRAPALLIPGNHDDRNSLRQAFSDHAYLPQCGPLHYAIDDHAVRIVALDSCVPGRHHGELDDAALDWLATVLAQRPDQPTLLMLHHPPFATGMASMDRYRLQSPERLERIVAAAPQVERVVCGHLHRTTLRRWAGTVACSAPSTATEIDLQFDAASPSASHAGPRGFMLHRWAPGDGLVSHVVSTEDFAGPFGFD